MVLAEACVDQRLACVHADSPSTGMTITLRRLPDGAEIDFERKDQPGRQGRKPSSTSNFDRRINMTAMCLKQVPGFLVGEALPTAFADSSRIIILQRRLEHFLQSY